MSQKHRTETRTETKTETRVDYDDVDDIIGIAAEMKDADADKLTLEELQEVGRELDIDPQYVEKAATELERRRKAEATAQTEAAAKKKRLMIGVGVSAAAVAAVVAISGVVSANSLKSAIGDVETRRAQVENVLDRQTKIVEQFKDAPADVARKAELTGAENRVRVERRRYDEAASAYNTKAGSFPHSLWTGALDMPERIPLSNEITEWKR